MKTPIALSILGALLLLPAGSASAAEKAAKGGGNQTYLVTTTHTPEQCLQALDEMAAKNKKMLGNMEWGCKSGDHTGYAFVKAASEEQALAQLPETNRATAKAVMVTKFTPEQLAAIHKQMGKQESQQEMKH